MLCEKQGKAGARRGCASPVRHDQLSFASCRPRTPARARFRDGPLFDGAPDAANDGNSSMEIAEWLRGLNLSRYEAAFRDNEIDWDVLPDLTDFDLERLGVPMGHRKRLLRAIAKLGRPGRSVAAFPCDAAPMGRQGRATAIDPHVLRSRWLDSPRRPARSRGYGRTDPRVSGRGFHRNREIRRAGRQVVGR